MSFVLVLFILLRGQRIVSERLVNGQLIVHWTGSARARRVKKCCSEKIAFEVFSKRNNTFSNFTIITS